MEGSIEAAALSNADAISVPCSLTERVETFEINVFAAA